MITYEQLDNLILVDAPFDEQSMVDEFEVIAQSMKMVVESHVKLRKVGLRHDGYGMIIAIVDAEACVLWSFELVLDSFSNFLPPMSMPSGLVFLMDYTYGSGSLGTSSLGEA